MRNDIVTCARGWIGTRFHHQGRLKKTQSHKGGVDCMGLLIGVAHELDLRGGNDVRLADFDSTNYSHYPDTAALRAGLAAVMQEIPPGGMKPGDVALLHIDSQPQHLAVVGDNENALTLIHAYAPARAVVEHALDDYWRQKIVAVFRVISAPS